MPINMITTLNNHYKSNEVIQPIGHLNADSNADCVAAMIRRRLPPFGKTVVRRLTLGVPMNVWVFAGDRAWREASWRNRYIGPGFTLMLPPGESPDAYRWPVRGQHLMLVWLDGSHDEPCQHIGQDELTEFAQVLLENGASKVTAVSTDGFLFFEPVTRKVHERRTGT